MGGQRFGTILPVLQLFIAAALLGRGHRALAPRSFDTLYVPSSTLICFGINAPALLFKSIWYVLPRASVAVFGFSAEELTFLLGVVVVWCFVGCALDRHALSRGLTPQRATGKRRLHGIVEMVVGLFLLYAALVPIRSQSFNNAVGHTLEFILFASWSLALISAATLTLVDWSRHDRGSTGSTPLRPV